MTPKIIFVTGGVVSGLGKGVSASSIAALLKLHGYKIDIRKLDPYLNVDPGLMSPYQHGEVFVTDDGTEADLDLGHYERFTGINCKESNSITSGKIYKSIIEKEREGGYCGNTVQIIPHVTNAIKKFILSNTEYLDFLICEIGGTVGDIEALPYLEAVRQIGYELGFANVLYIHLTLIPYISAAMELKTKPTQHSVKELRSLGIQPNMILCRVDRAIPEDIIKKISLFSNVLEEHIIEAKDEKTIYQIPLSYQKQGVDVKILKYFGLNPAQRIDLSPWNNLVESIINPQHKVKVAIIAKYSQCHDAYKSLLESLLHAGAHYNCKVEVVWVEAEDANINRVAELLGDVNGVIVPGGFGERGIEMKIASIKYVRENNIPFLGICLGMQLAAIEFARNILRIDDANSAEFYINGSDNVIFYGENQMSNTMRLGSLDCILKDESLIHNIYGAKKISERHRHRLRFNQLYEKKFTSEGMSISAISDDGSIVEAMELQSHKWFLGVQFHPEFKSKIFDAHPIFLSFLAKTI